MKIYKEQIESYIPQRAPFIMVDNLVEATSEKFETDFLIRDDNIFLEEEVLREFALIENIAQSSAAGLSFLFMQKKAGPADGFIGAISKLVVHELPLVNEKIYTIINLLYQFDNMFLLSGVTYVNNKKLLECELKLVGRVSQIN